MLEVGKSNYRERAKNISEAINSKRYSKCSRFYRFKYFVLEQHKKRLCYYHRRKCVGSDWLDYKVQRESKRSVSFF